MRRPVLLFFTKISLEFVIHASLSSLHFSSCSRFVLPAGGVSPPLGTTGGTPLCFPGGRPSRGLTGGDSRLIATPEDEEDELDPPTCSRGDTTCPPRCSRGDTPP